MASMCGENGWHWINIDNKGAKALDLTIVWVRWM